MKKAIILFLISIILIASSGIIYANKIVKSSNIHKGIFVEGVSVSDLTKDEALKILESTFSFGQIKFIHEDKEWEYDLRDLGFFYELQLAVDEAYDIGRSHGFVKNLSEIISLRAGSDINIPITRNENFDSFEPIFDEIAQAIDQNPQNATISINSEINIQDGIEGFNVEKESLKNIVHATLAKENSAVIEVPIETRAPDITTQMLRRINGIIGEYTTTFNANVAGRSQNIRLASSSVSDVLILPGQEFSFNDATGRITIANGYKNAPVIVAGVLQEGVGGGVCQVSSTLYNSVLYAGLDVVQRRAHSIPSTYVDIGRDAVVVHGVLDLKFKNTHDFPVYIKTYVSGNKVRAAIYGDSTNHRRVTLSSEIVEVIPRQVEYKNDPSIPTGKEVVEDPGRDGIKSVTYSVLNGERKVVSRDHYPTRKKVIKVGTGPALDQTPEPSIVKTPENQDDGLREEVIFND